MLLTGQCGVGPQVAIPSNAGEEKARLLKSQVIIFLSQNQRVCPGAGFPSPLGITEAAGHRLASQHRASSTRPHLWRGDRETRHPRFCGSVINRGEWRTPSPPRESPPGCGEVTGVARSGSHRCLKGKEKALELGWVRCRLGALGRGPLALV